MAAEVTQDVPDAVVGSLARHRPTPGEGRVTSLKAVLKAAVRDTRCRRRRAVGGPCDPIAGAPREPATLGPLTVALAGSIGQAGTRIAGPKEAAEIVGTAAHPIAMGVVLFSR